MGKAAKAPKAPKASGGRSKKAGGGFLMEKGEKVLIAVGAAGLLILSVVGVMSFASARSPAEIVKSLKQKESNVRATINSEGEGAPPLPEWVTKSADFKAIPADQFALSGPTFEPIHQPDLLRENPRVLGVMAWQIDAIRGPMRSLDILLPTDENGEVKIGVLINKVVAPKDVASVGREIRSALGNLDIIKGHNKSNRTGKRNPRTARNPNPPRGAMPPMQPGGIPGAAMPGADMAGAGMPGPMDQFGASIGAVPANMQRDDKTVQYLTPTEVAKQNLPLAETVFPFRAIVVQTAFPLKAQIEEIKRALRLHNTNTLQPGAPGAATGPVAGPARLPMGPMAPGGPGFPGSPAGPGGMSQAMANPLNPEFDGFQVERRIITPSGQVLDWAPYDHESEYFSKIRSRKVADVPDNEYLPYFLRYDQKLAAPLPEMADNLGSYPPLRIPAIYDAIDRLRDLDQPPPTESDWQKRFKGSAGDQNPYAPFTGLLNNTNNANPGMMPPGGPTGNPPFGSPPFGTPPGAGAIPGQMNPMAQHGPDLDVLLLRFLDVDVLPGYSYQYRIRVRMKNPNFGKEKEVREPNDAKKEILEGPWVILPEIVTFPAEAHLYAYNTEKYVETSETIVRDLAAGDVKALGLLNLLYDVLNVKRGRHAVVQMQTWMPQVRATGSSVEPVGTWVVSEMPVVPGEYIGRRQLVKLPLWSSSAAGYILRELANAIAIQGVPQKSQPKGWAVNFETKSVLIDFEGGNVRQDIAGKRVEDATATELLILRPDGKLTYRNSARDMADAQRTARDKEWNDWLTRVRDRRDSATNPMDAGSGFKSRITP
ncbi:MAG: hypothetical protein LC104_16715 [Bacteroidales bacterium]|nr:hypothetical protein [Bacteroidales bacterium]